MKGGEADVSGANDSRSIPDVASGVGSTEPAPEEETHEEWEAGRNREDPPMARQEAHETWERVAMIIYKHVDVDRWSWSHCEGLADDILATIPVGEPTKTFQLLDGIERSLAHETRWEKLSNFAGRTAPDNDFGVKLKKVMAEIEEAIPVPATEADDEDGLVLCHDCGVQLSPSTALLSAKGDKRPRCSSCLDAADTLWSQGEAATEAEPVSWRAWRELLASHVENDEPLNAGHCLGLLNDLTHPPGEPE